MSQSYNLRNQINIYHSRMPQKQIRAEAEVEDPCSIISQTTIFLQEQYLVRNPICVPLQLLLRS